MSNFSRLQKRLARQGIDSHYHNQIYYLQRNGVMANLLLPDTLPLEEKAAQQLLDFAAVNWPESNEKVYYARATPDFHPGTIAPVGSIIASTPDLVVPAAIGSDINCGMRLINMGLSYEQASQQQVSIIELFSKVLLHDQRDVPVTPDSFYALFDDGLTGWLQHLPQQGIWQQVDFARLKQELGQILALNLVQANSAYAPEPFLADRAILRPATLGTVGSGNHFVELQVVEQILDRHAAYQAGFQVGQVMAMIHTGSRDVGFYIGQRWQDQARAQWPVGHKYPKSGLFPLVAEAAQQYLLAMGCAARYAWINRIVLTELLREAWRAIFNHDQSKLLVDISHNIILTEQGMNIHRKGTTPAHQGSLALIPGSMGDYSYVVMGKGHPDWLWSCSHGAGRSVRRQQMHSKRGVSEGRISYPWQCITLKQDRLREEAPMAYKPITPVIEVQQQAGLIEPVAKLRPWLTFKI